MSRVIAYALVLASSVVASCGGHDPDPIVRNIDCVQCHRGQFEDATDPVHVDLIPTGCTACHNTDQWRPQDNAGHDRLFEITAGPHRRFGCDECHPPPQGLFAASCRCHESSLRVDGRGAALRALDRVMDEVAADGGTP